MGRPRPMEGRVVTVELALKLRQRIRSCTACHLHSTCKAPVPFRGPVPAKLVVVGQNPGALEDKEGKPFIGPSGQLIRDVFNSVGLSHDIAAFVNAVSCNTDRNREPTREEIAACRFNLADQLSVLQPQRILVMGKVALSAFSQQLELRHARGRWLYWDGQDWGRPTWWATGGVPMMVTYHPAAALRGKKQYMDAIIEDVGKLRADEPTWEESCVVCGSEVDRYDPMGVPRCQHHLNRQLSLLASQ